MTISNSLEQHLAARHIPFEVVTHSPTMSASRTAQVSHISGNKLAKAVVLKDELGYLLAVLPASHHIQFDVLYDVLDRKLSMASEVEIGELFVDCELGAIPPVGFAYGIDMIVDDALDDLPDIYLEGGDHTCLLRISGNNFDKMMRSAQHGNFSRHD